VDDLGAERSRIERELGKVEKEEQQVEAKLGNPSFVERAPDEVVEEVRARGAQLSERREALTRSLERLREMEA
jgi:valyl-tRNA synthetase